MVAFLERICGSMMLVTRPEHDPGLRYLSAWSTILIMEAKQKGFDVMDLVGNKARRNEVEGRLKKKRPNLVMLNGHGASDCVTGHDNEILVRAHDNAGVLEGSITYAVSCNSAALLGKEVGSLPDTVYIGYEKEFALPFSNDFLNRPLEDPYAKPFMEFSNYIVTSLLKGHSAFESTERAKSLGNSRIRSLLSSATDSNMGATVPFLWRDVQCLTCKGEQDKRVV